MKVAVPLAILAAQARLAIAPAFDAEGAVGAGAFCEGGHVGRIDQASRLARPRPATCSVMAAFPTVPNGSAKHQNEGTWT